MFQHLEVTCATDSLLSTATNHDYEVAMLKVALESAYFESI